MSHRELYRSPSGEVRRVVWEPGNGTRYEMIATRVPGSHLWLIAGGDFWGGAMLLYPGASVDMTYLAEKLARRYGGTYNHVDGSEMIKCACMLVPDVHGYVHTDETGHDSQGAVLRWTSDPIDWDAVEPS